MAQCLVIILLLGLGLQLALWFESVLILALLGSALGLSVLAGQLPFPHRGFKSFGGIGNSVLGSLRPVWLLVVVWTLQCRIGEAAVPGPNAASWSLGVCNPSGLMGKTHLLSTDVDIWLVCETHFSVHGCRNFGKSLRAIASPFKWFVHGVGAPVRSIASDLGKWTGDGVLSQHPSRAVPAGLSDELLDTGRVVVSTTHVAGIWLTGLVMYGAPTGPTHPQAKAFTNRMLHQVVDRIQCARGPRFVAGDWNHDLDSLEAVGRLISLGFVEVQDLYASRSGICPRATCRGKTRRDFLFISAELIPAFRMCWLDDHAWVDHSALVAEFDASPSAFVQFPWPTPHKINWAAAAARRPAAPVADALADPSAGYRRFWQGVEASASAVFASQNRRLLPNQFGRGSRFQPCVRHHVPPPKCGRRGELQPTFLGHSWIHSMMFRQVRRLQSYARLAASLQHSPSHTEHRIALWKSILNARGFKPTFAEWWRDLDRNVGEPLSLPLVAPGSAMACRVFQRVEFETRKIENVLVKQTRRDASLRRSRDVNALYKVVKRDMPLPVDTLVNPCHFVISAVDPDDLSLEVEPAGVLADLPTFVGGRPVDPIHVEHDKLWLPDVSGFDVGDSVVQHRAGGQLHDIFAAFSEHWNAFWQRHADMPSEAWNRVFAFADRVLRPVDVPPVDLTVDLFHSVVAGKKNRAAIGLDGVSKLDLQSLRPSEVSQILAFYKHAACTGTWPEQLCVGAVKSLAKSANPLGTNDYRPICVFSLVYRVWSTIQSKYWLHTLDSFWHDDLFGSRPGRRAAHLWRVIVDCVQDSYVHDVAHSGLVLDLTKAFNTLPRVPVLGLALKCGVDFGIVQAWAGFLGGMQRRFVVRNSLGPPVSSTCGVPEGCGLSCLAMLMINQLLHSWLAAFAPRVRCFSYVDNWELVSTDAECLLRANRSILDFARLLDLTLDTSKTVAWSTDRGIRRQLRQSGFTVSLSGRDLGAHVVYSRQIRNQTIQLRISDLQDFWNKLRGAFGAYKQKVRVVVTAAWPRIFHGISASVLGLKHFAELRTEFMRAVDAARPQASPYLHMILEGLHLDPQLYAIIATFRDFRDFGCAPDQLVTLNDVAAGPSGAPNGVAEILLMRVHQLGWRLGVDGLVTDRFGSFFLHLLNFAELLQRVACAWQLVVSEHVKHRAPFSTFHLVDVGATTVDLHSRDASSQGSLRKNLNGGAFANDVAWKCSVSGDKACRACGVEDTLYHRYWQCPSTQHLRDSLDPQVLSVLDDLPPVLTVHGWTLSSPFADEWRCRLIALPDVVPSCVCDLTGDGPLHLFTDGSCFWPSEPAYRLAAWSVCVAASCSGSDAFTSHVAGGGCLSGLTQTAFRAELYAVCAALTYGALTSRPIVVYSDCKSVVTRACAMQHGVCCHKPNVHNSDLWQWLADLLVQVGPRVQFVKVKAHVVLAQTSSHRDLWLGYHNLCADRAAVVCNQDRGSSFWDFWRKHVDLVSRHQFVGRHIRDHIVAVNLAWFSDPDMRDVAPDQPIVAPAVPAGAAARPGVWGWQESLSLPRKFSGVYGAAYGDVLVQWCNGLFLPGQEGAQWVSFAELFVDFQRHTGHFGPLLISGKWRDPAVNLDCLPQRFSFRARCKWFRLSLQALWKTAQVTVSRQTRRSQSSYCIHAHVGCAFVQCRADRLRQTNDVIVAFAKKPILGQGEALDQLPWQFHT